ncbi:MAG: MATE family efflux transporter [Candidatus Latescibacterota bacterium]
MNTPQRDLTEGSIVRNIWHLALPMMVGNVLQNAFSLVDMIFVGRLGPSAIAAVGMSGVVLGFLFVVIIGIYTGTVALVSRFIGARSPSEAENVAMQSLFLGGFCFAAVAGIGYPLAPYILQVLGAGEEVVRQGIPYLRISFLGSFAMIFSVVLGSVLRAAGDAITPLKIMVLSTVLNIVLDPLMIFGWGAFPALGVAGSALATVLSTSLGTALLLWIFLRGRGVVRLRMAHAHVDFPLMGRIIHIGIFASIQAILRNVSGVILTRLVTVYGTYAVAAYMISMRLQMMVMMPAFGLAGAVATLVGQNLGAGKPDRAARTAWITAAVGFAIMTVFGIAYILFSRSIFGVFTDDPGVVHIGTQILQISAGFFGFIGIAIILSRALAGAGDTLSPMVITAIGLLVIRLALALLFSWKLGLVGIWLGMTAGITIHGVMVAAWFHTGRWKLKRV